jgi:hypothetical protein
MGAYVDSLQERASSSATFRPASASSQASERNSSSDWFDELYTVLLPASIALSAVVLYTVFEVWG